MCYFLCCGRVGLRGRGSTAWSGGRNGLAWRNGVWVFGLRFGVEHVHVGGDQGVPVVRRVLGAGVCRYAGAGVRGFCRSSWSEVVCSVTRVNICSVVWLVIFGWKESRDGDGSGG